MRPQLEEGEAPAESGSAPVPPLTLEMTPKQPDKPEKPEPVVFSAVSPLFSKESRARFEPMLLKKGKLAGACACMCLFVSVCMFESGGVHLAEECTGRGLLPARVVSVSQCVYASLCVSRGRFGHVSQAGG